MSLILLQSEKQIKPGLLDSSDRPEDFVNIFRKPIQIRDNQTIELVSMSYNKQGDITVNTTNDTVIFRVGDNKNYLNKTVKVKQGTYTPAAFAIQLATDLNNSNILNQYVWSVTISGTFIYLTLNQDSRLTVTNDGGTTSGETTGDIKLPLENDEGAIDTFTTIRKQVVFGNTEYATVAQELEVEDDRELDVFEELYYATLFPKPLFSNAPILRTEVYPQFHITGLLTAQAIAAPTTFTSGAVTGNLAAYTGSNLYNAQFTLGAVTYYLKYGSDYTGSIKNFSATETLWFQRGEIIIVSKTDVAIPTTIDQNIDLTNFGMNGMVYDDSVAASLTSTVQSFGRKITGFTNFYGVSLAGITVTDLAEYINWTKVGYNNSSIGLFSKTTWGESGTGIDEDRLLEADYSLSLEQTGKTVGTSDTKVLLKCLKGDKDANASVGFFYKVGAAPEHPTAVNEIDLEVIAGVVVSGSSMDNLRLKLGTLAGVKSQVVFSLEKESSASPGMWIGVLTGRFAAENELTEDFYPLYGAIATSPGSYGQALGTASANVFAGTFNTRAYTPTAKNLKELGVIDPDNVVDSSAPVEGASAETKQKLTFFIRFGIVPESSISADNSAGTNLSLINIQDVENQGAEVTRNRTSNTADLNLIINQNVFSRYNVGISDTYYGMPIGPIISTDYLNENINVQLPDFPIRSFNGLLGQPENCVSIIPAEQISTDAVTGRLYYQSSVPNKINMNNNGEQLINHVRVRLTTPEGQPVTNLLHPTSIVLKIDDKS